MYCGLWGYIHRMRPELLKDLDAATFDKNEICELLMRTETKQVDLNGLMPTEEEYDHWILTLKNQIATVLLQHVKHQHKVTKTSSLNLPPVNQIKCEIPDLFILKMMDSTDNRSEGVGKLLQEVIHQSGLDKESFLNHIQIPKGDLGTCLNFDSLRKQRDPTNLSHKNLKKILLIPGAGHTLWNVAQAILLRHCVDPSYIDDFGAWQTVVALGGSKDAPTAKKDFTSMLRWIETIHEAILTHALLYSWFEYH